MCRSKKSKRKGQNFPTTRDILSFIDMSVFYHTFHVLLKKETKPQDLGVVAHTRKVIFHFSNCVQSLTIEAVLRKMLKSTDLYTVNIPIVS